MLLEQLITQDNNNLKKFINIQTLLLYIISQLVNNKKNKFFLALKSS